MYKLYFKCCGLFMQINSDNKKLSELVSHDKNRDGPNAQQVNEQFIIVSFLCTLNGTNTDKCVRVGCTEGKKNEEWEWMKKELRDTKTNHNGNECHVGCFPISSKTGTKATKNNPFSYFMFGLCFRWWFYVMQNAMASVHLKIFDSWKIQWFHHKIQC